MAYIQKTIPSPNKVFEFSLNDFSGGMNNASKQLNANEATEILNMKFSDTTLMEKRKGQDYYDELVIKDNEEIPLPDEITFIDEFKPYTNPDVLIRASKLKIYADSTKIADVFGDVCGVNFNGIYVFADGSDLYAYGTFPKNNRYIHSNYRNTY